MDASIEIISSIEKHPNADKLDIVKILGFNCITQKDLYVQGLKIIYIRPDSVLPIESWTEEYRKYSPKRVKSIKLRGEFSEGIIVPFDILPNGNDLKDLEVGTDVAEMIGVFHYDAPSPQDLQAKGGLPYCIFKTDQERCLFEDTLMQTEDGIKSIKEICEIKYKGKIKSFNIELSIETFENITDHSIMSNNNDWFKLTLESGQNIIATSNHKFYLPSLNCYRELKELKENDYLFVELLKQIQ